MAVDDRLPDAQTLLREFVREKLNGKLADFRDFDFETLPQERFQPRGTINYTVSEDFTRISEFKYFSAQDIPDATTIVREYPRAYTGEAGQIPYYAIISDENRAHYERYLELANAYPNFHPLGRLAEYRYYNMDVICLKALELADELLA